MTTPPTPTRKIPIPYEGYQPLVLDHVAIGNDAEDIRRDLNFIFNTARNVEEELERIMRAAVILYDAQAGTFAECFHTAVVWERG